MSYEKYCSLKWNGEDSKYLLDAEFAENRNLYENRVEKVWVV